MVSTVSIFIWKTYSNLTVSTHNGSPVRQIFNRTGQNSCRNVVAKAQLGRHAQIRAVIAHFTCGRHGSRRQLENPVTKLNRKHSDLLDVACVQKVFPVKSKRYQNGGTNIQKQNH